MLKKALTTAVATAATAGVLMTGTAFAYSGDDVITSGKGSVLGGNQLVTDVNVPVNVCGNAIAILGIASAHCHASGATVFQ